jgi:hypothetical protein
MNRQLVFGLAMAAGAALFGLAPVANATTTSSASFYNDPNDPSGPTGLRFTLDCSSLGPDCASIEVLQSSSTFDSTDPLTGGLFKVHPSNPTAEADFVFDNTGVRYTSYMKTENPGATFTTSGTYIVIKIGDTKTKLSDALVYNPTGSSLTLTFNQQGQGGGLSHYTVFGSGGTPVPVPEPAELGIFGFGVLLIGGFIGMRRRWQ